MSISQILSLLSGIALFLFGMGLMGDGLKKLSGSRLEPILYKLSGTPIRGVLLGTGVTAVIQSSSATSVMVVGFVNSGMMKVRQGISVILGAIIGTSITGWVICLSYIESAGSLSELLSTSTITCVVAVAGIICRMTGKKQSTRYLGDILMGFAVLMFGMSTMSASVRDLGKAEWFTRTLSSLSHPLTGILVGAVFTAILQSCSAAIGILQALSVTGAISFAAALPLLTGIMIGASVPVLFSAIGAGTAGKRTAWVYPVATVLGAILISVLFYGANALLHFAFMDRTVNPFSVAFINTVLRVVAIGLLLPCTKLIETLVCALVPEKKNARDLPIIRLEERFLAHPALAIEQCRLSMQDMANASEDDLMKSFTLFGTFEESVFEEVRSLENTVDRYEDALGTYLVRFTGRELTDSQNREVSMFLHTLSDFERISDHALNLAHSAREMAEKQVHFSEKGQQELDVLIGAVTQAVGMTMTAFREGDLALAGRVEPLTELIEDLGSRLNLNHTDRLQKGLCTIQQGFVFHDVVSNCERVAGHCSNIALAMIELTDEAYSLHEYAQELKEKQSPAFRAAYREYAERFKLQN